MAKNIDFYEWFARQLLTLPDNVVKQDSGCETLLTCGKIRLGNSCFEVMFTFKAHHACVCKQFQEVNHLAPQWLGPQASRRRLDQSDLQIASSFIHWRLDAYEFVCNTFTNYTTTKKIKILRWTLTRAHNCVLSVCSVLFQRPKIMIAEYCTHIKGPTPWSLTLNPLCFLLSNASLLFLRNLTTLNILT